MRILIAEHEPDSRIFLRKALEALGHDCVQAESGKEAWELFETVKPDIVICDLRMPEVDGLELCTRVHAAQTDNYVYCIALCQRADMPALLASLKAGIDDFLFKPFESAELEARMIVAERVATTQREIRETGMELDRVNTELYEEGRRDPLTRVGNRLRLEEDLEALSGRARRYGHSFCVLLADLDHFKKYNNTCGNTAGDETLRGVARTIAAFGRSGDMTYRFSGEQFMIVVPEQPLERAVIAAERRRQAIEKLDIPHPASPFGHITISTGVAAFNPEDEEPLPALLARAEAALVEAKARGRNRVHVDSSDEERASVIPSAAPPSSPP